MKQLGFLGFKRPAPYTNARDLRKQAGSPVCAYVLDYMESEDSDEEPEDPDDSAPSLTRGAVTALALAALPWVLAAGRLFLPVTSVATGYPKGSQLSVPLFIRFLLQLEAMLVLLHAAGGAGAGAAGHAAATAAAAAAAVGICARTSSGIGFLRTRSMTHLAFSRDTLRLPEAFSARSTANVGSLTLKGVSRSRIALRSGGR